MQKLKQFFTLLKKTTRNSAGFSLIEILIALTLLGLAATFVAGRIFESLYEGQVKSAKIQMNGLAAQLKEFRRKCGFYPTTDQGLEALVGKPAGKECRNYPPGGFIDGGQVPNDPWDVPFVYESDGTTFNIYSLGQDGVEGGEEKDADIYLYDKAQ